MQETIVTLNTIANGAAVELFDRELQRVIQNIADPNTSAKARREIHIKVTILPDEERSIGYARIECASKLGDIKPVQTVMYFGRNKENKLVAVANNIIQPSMFDQPENQNVTPIRALGGAQ